MIVAISALWPTLALNDVTATSERVTVRKAESDRSRHAHANARVKRIRQARMLFEGVGG